MEDEYTLIVGATRLMLKHVAAYQTVVIFAPHNGQWHQCLRPSSASALATVLRKQSLIRALPWTVKVELEARYSRDTQFMSWMRSQSRVDALLVAAPVVRMRVERQTFLLAGRVSLVIPSAVAVCLLPPVRSTNPPPVSEVRKHWQHLP